MRWRDALAEEPWQSIAVGGYHALALTEDGALHAWGENYYGQCRIPLGDQFTAVAAGQYHSLALRRDGSIAAWGDNTRGQCLAPRGRGFVAIAAGNWHSLAIRSDGTVVGWGWNKYGQCDVSCVEQCTAICAGYSHSLALTQNGALLAWGSNTDGQCDVPEGNNFVDVAAGAFHSVALRSDGSLAAWGRDDDGQCEVPIGTDFVGIAAGAFHSLALRAEGTVAAWGYNSYGQCDLPSEGHMAAIVAGGYLTFGVAAEGQATPLLATTASRKTVTSETPMPVASETAPMEDAQDASSEETPTVFASSGEMPMVAAGEDRPMTMAFGGDDSTARVVDSSLNPGEGESQSSCDIPMAKADDRAQEPVTPVGSDERATLAGRVPAEVSPFSDQAFSSRFVEDVTSQVSLVLAACIGFGLAAITTVFVLLRREARKWRAQRKQKQEGREAVLWDLLLEGDEHQVLAPPHDR